MAGIGQDQTVSDPVDKLILLAIANRANDEGRDARPDLAEFARWAGCSERTVQRRILRLAAQGRFTRERKRWENGRLGRWEYTLHQPPAPNTGLASGPGASLEYERGAWLQDQVPDPNTSLACGQVPAANTSLACGPGATPEYERGVSVRPEGTPSGTSTEPASAGTPETTERGKPPREPDVVFEAVCEVTGIDSRALTATARGPLNRAVAELRKVGATPDEVRRRARRYRETFSVDIALTPMALAKHWPTLGAPVYREPEEDPWQREQREREEADERLRLEDPEEWQRQQDATEDSRRRLAELFAGMGKMP
jgi:hypothetical protein